MKQRSLCEAGSGWRHLTHQDHSDRSKAAGQTLAERPFAKAAIAFRFVLHRLQERWTKVRRAEAGRVSDIGGRNHSI